MFERKKLQNLNDYFKPLSARAEKGVFFCRINAFSDAVKIFIKEYYEAARLSGVVIEGKIQNPDEKNLAYYETVMGLDFQMSVGFFNSSLKKWLPRLKEAQRGFVSAAMYDTLDEMREEGKNENILRNAYIKFMCWLYYKFERIVNQLGTDNAPKILYEGDISAYELKLFKILSNAGCDVVLLQYHGDGAYTKLDPSSSISDAYSCDGLTDFPDGFSIGQIRKEIEDDIKAQRIYGALPKALNCTNAWIEGRGFGDILKGALARGADTNLFYNCFYRINGVEDKLTYMNELYQFQLQLKNSQRRLVIVENEIPQPSMDEIKAISRKNYSSREQAISDLSKNITYTYNIELQRLMVKAFIDVMLEWDKESNMSVNRIINKAVYLLCWLKRYQSRLFANWKMPEISCFIYLGACKSMDEAMFLKMLSRLPADVLVLNPGLNSKCCLEDKFLYEITHSESLEVTKYPREEAAVLMGTAAYHAERELDTLMYQDSGFYRSQQYQKASSVTLKTTYEEIAILWNQELKYRPNFSVINNIVSMPVIFAKASGVKDGDVSRYWADIRQLITKDTFVIKGVPYIKPTDENPLKAHAVEFFKNGRLQRNKIKNHPSYQYGFIREEMQNYILDKLQMLIERKLIAGTLVNGAEYTIISTVLNLNLKIIRMIQKFDFTKKNPKLIYIDTTESMMSLEDAVMAAFLNLTGFDVAVFVPTGYQNIEKYFAEDIMEEHQVGEYVYDLQTPHLEADASYTRRSWREKLFKRGN